MYWQMVVRTAHDYSRLWKGNYTSTQPQQSTRNQDIYHLAIYLQAMTCLEKCGLGVKMFITGWPATKDPDRGPDANGDEYDEFIPRSHKCIKSQNDIDFSIHVRVKLKAVVH